jgi:hypothetical protein
MNPALLAQMRANNLASVRAFYKLTHAWLKNARYCAERGYWDLAASAFVNGLETREKARAIRRECR